MTPPKIQAGLAKLVASCGFRVSSVDARRAGVPEHILFDAVQLGLARLERTYFTTCVSTYVVFA
jgi:hypothetical protein